MIRSMTGYGEAERSTSDGRLLVTIKTVNHRFFNAHLRTPPGFDRFESEIQGWLRRHFARGHINYTLTHERERAGGNEDLPTLDLARARHYRELLGDLKKELALPGEVELQALLRFNDLFQAPDLSDRELEIDGSVLEDLTEEAARAALEMREREGSRLQDDLLDRLKRMEEELSTIERRAPERLLAERDRLRDAISELAEQAEVDEDRLAKEVAYMADRWDINEELVRFRAHLGAFRETLASGSGEAVGKRLGFLVQELHREANTIGSKANDLEVSHSSVAIREEIERLREQLENVE
jgi:uncharacterized protein (TIGR00255 family)